MVELVHQELGLAFDHSSNQVYLAPTEAFAWDNSEDVGRISQFPIYKFNLGFKIVGSNKILSRKI